MAQREEQAIEIDGEGVIVVEVFADKLGELLRFAALGVERGHPFHGSAYRPQLGYLPVKTVGLIQHGETHVDVVPIDEFLRLAGVAGDAHIPSGRTDLQFEPVAGLRRQDIQKLTRFHVPPPHFPDHMRSSNAKRHRAFMGTAVSSAEAPKACVG